MAWALGGLGLAAVSLPLGAQDTAPPPAATAEEPAPDAVPTRFADLNLGVQEPPPALIGAAQFAAGSQFRSFDMSPDGARLAIARKAGKRQDVIFIDTATRETNGGLNVPEDKSLDWVRWAGNDKLILSISFPTMFYGVSVRASRLLVHDLAKNVTFPLKVGRDVIWGGDVVHVAEDGSHALIAVQDNLMQTPSVYRYDLVPEGAVEKVVRPRDGVWEWYADEAGTVRLGLGWVNRRLKVYYRKDGAADFALVGKIKAGDDKARYWSVVRIVEGSDRGYVLEEGENGRVGVRLFDYATGEPVETYWEHPQWDVEELWLKRDGTPLAATYTDDRDRIHWFDAQRGRTHASLQKALEMEDVSIVTRSRGDERMLVWGGSEADPGALYLFDPAGKKLDLLSNYRPDLDFRLLAKPQPVRYRARDGLMISAYLTLPRGRTPKGLPLIIMPHGGPFGIRDKLAYDDWVQFLANRGYAVLQPNFRGSGGYGDDFFAAGEGQVGRGMQDDLDDAMDWATGEGIADPARICVIGGSYGGYAALWAVLRNPERYRCAASWAGVTDWDKMLAYDRRFLTGKAGKSWQARIRGDEAFDLDAVSPYRLAAQLKRPVLLAHGTADDNVPFSQYTLFVKATRAAAVRPQTLEIEGEGHGFSKPENEQQWYEALDAFLAKHNPADPLPQAVSAPGATVVEPASPPPPVP